jgi:hypothetical protein
MGSAEVTPPIPPYAKKRGQLADCTTEMARLKILLTSGGYRYAARQKTAATLSLVGGHEMRAKARRRKD